MLLLPLLVVLLPHLVSAGPEEDAARLGQYYTNIAIYRSGSGNNVVSVGIGDPEQEFNLTLTTNVEFVLVASDDCDNCVSAAERYNADDSRTITTSQRAVSVTAIYPTSDGSIDALQLGGNFVTERLTDPREDSYDRVVGIIDEVDEVTTLGRSGRAGTLPDGISGFFGLGVFQANKQLSLMPSLLQVDGRGAPAGVTSYVVGVDMAPFSRDENVQAGDLHMGGVPVGAYTGNFNWLSANTSVSGSWGVPVNRVRVARNVVGTDRYYGSLDPGFDAIYVPDQLAQDIFSGVTDAERDVTDPRRWNVPCDADIPMIITIDSKEYRVDSSQLVQQRGVSPNSCWSSIVAWQEGSLPDARGDIRLGTPFLAGVYAAFYYSEREQLVGLAGKPDSVNDQNLYARDRGQANGKLAGILIGSLLAGLIVLLLLCYGRNRSSFQSIWYRHVRRQHRAQVNALVRAATIPPPIIGAGMVVPPPMPPPGPMMAMAPGMNPMMAGGGAPAYMPVPGGPQHMHMGYPGGPGHGGWQAPPMYQPPMQPQPQPQQGQYPQQQQQYAAGYPQQHGGGHGQQPLPPNAIPPPSTQHAPQGFYSPRHHSLPAQISHAFSRSPRPQRSPAPPRYSHPPLERDLGEAGPAAPHYGPAPLQQSDRSKVPFDPAPSRHKKSRHHKRYDEESMVERDRAKVAAEAAEQAEVARQGGPLPGRQQQRLHQPEVMPSPTMSQKRRWWLSRNNHPGYAAAATHEDDVLDHQQAQMQAQAAQAGAMRGGGGGRTGDSKSFFSERGWNKWSRQEREQDRRASQMGGGPWCG